MKKIAILGCENTHANAFIKFIKEKDEFSDVEVLGVYSDDNAAAEKLNEAFSIPVMKSYDELVGKVDGIIVTARHGDNHYKYAKPYIDSGVPMFIDKPITVSEQDVIDFMKEIKDKGIRVCGGSSLKHDTFIAELKKERLTDGEKTLGGYVRAPYSKVNDYGDFYFYAQHLVEMVCEVFGSFPKSVKATETNENITVVFNYDDFDAVGLFCNKNYHYFASRMSTSKSTAYTIPDSADWFYREFKEYYELLCGGPQTVSLQELASPVFIMNAIQRSLKNGSTENVKILEI